MLKKELIDTQTSDFVEIKSVSKIYKRRLRENAGKGLIKNLFNPQIQELKALDNVSFNVRQGEFIAYAGPNGAGKSTTMKIISGMLQPTDGEVRVLGMSPLKNRVEIMKNLGVLFGNRTELWWDHPVLQSFEWKKGVWDIEESVYKRNLDMVTDLLDIGDILKTFVRELSLGQRMKADLALMLLHSPKIILLDEPTLGLDVVAKRNMIDFLKKINKEERTTIVVTSHDMDDLEEMAQRIVMISGGKKVYDGDFSGLRDITGSVTNFVVTTEKNKPEIKGATLISESDGVYEFEINLNRTPVSNLLQKLSEIDDIKDVEIKKTPIEKVIVQLYENWKA